MMVGFDKLFYDDTKHGRKIKREAYLQEGKTPIIDQGQDFISGYSNDDEGVYTNVPAIIFGDHTRIIKYIDVPFFLGADGVKIIKSLDKKSNYKYLYYLLKACNIPDTGYNRHFKYLKEAIFTEHSLAEQDSIVDCLDKIISIIENRNIQLQKLDSLIKSRFIEMFGDPVENPKRWKSKQLQELVTEDCTISYGIVQTGDNQDEGVPVFRPVDIVNHRPKRSELKKTTEEISNKYKKTILKGREMLITVRANIADTCIIGDEFRGCNVGRGIVPIRVKENEVSLEFLKHQIDSKHLNDHIKSLAKGITLIQLNMEDLREVNLIVPPIEKQMLFVNFVQEVDKSRLKLKSLVDKPGYTRQKNYYKTTKIRGGDVCLILDI